MKAIVSAFEKMELEKRRLPILGLFYFDLILHGSAVFGWNSMNQIFKLEVPDLSKEARKVLITM